MSDVTENAVKKARRLGLKLVLPSEYELFVDLDSHRAIEEFDLRLERLRGIFLIFKLEFTRSKSGWVHAYITLGDIPVDNTQRIAIQAALGSDPVREALAIKQIQEGCVHANCFFERPDAVRVECATAREFMLGQNVYPEMAYAPYVPF